jgi:hypothetical protein
MRMRIGRLLAVSTVLLWVLVLSTAILSMSAKASSYDGTYDITTNYARQSYTEHAFLTISDGQISNVYVDSLYNPSGMPSGAGSGGDTSSWWYTFTGTVDSNGNANWLGGCILAGGNMAYTYVGVIHLDGTGSGTWSKVGMESGTWSVQKTGGFALGSLDGIAPAVSAVAIAASVIALVAVVTPVKAPITPKTRSVQYNPDLKPSIQGETGPMSPPGPPGAGTPVGGAGLQYAPQTAGGKPLPPKDYFSKTSQDPPRCPIHGDAALVPHYFTADGSDSGSWFCPRCNNYPWGRS